MLKVRGLQVALALMVAGGATQASAQQKKSPEPKQLPKQLFGAASGGAMSDEVLGMRPGTVGAVTRVPLSLASISNLQSATASPRQLEIALPDGKSVTCLLRPVLRPQSMVVLGGTTVGGGEGERCNLVVANGRV